MPRPTFKSLKRTLLLLCVAIEMSQRCLHNLIIDLVFEAKQTLLSIIHDAFFLVVYFMFNLAAADIFIGCMTLFNHAKRCSKSP